MATRGRPRKVERETELMPETGKETVHDVHKGEKTYWVRLSNFAFVMVRRDKDGEKVGKTDRLGRQLYIGDEPAFVTKTLKFQCDSNSPVLGTLSHFTTKDPHIIAELEKKVADTGSPVLSQEMYEESNNPLAFKKASELLALQSAAAAKDDEINQLKLQLAKIEGGGQAKVDRDV